MSSFRHVEHCISRQSAHRSLNAFITQPDPAAVLEAAGKADSKPSDSSLHGRLITLKDNISTTSSPTTCASKALSTYTAPHPSTVATLLHRAGAIVAGKTNMDEFGMGSHSRPPHTGAVLSPFTRNPSTTPNGAPQAATQHLPLSPGGSSGGAAVAVATGQCFAAVGTDTGGSVRLPAAWTGTVGFKPSYGRVSRWGVVDYANSLDTVGVLARRVRDAGRVFGVLDREDGRDPTCLGRRTRGRVEEAVEGLRRGSEARGGRIRVGVPGEYVVAGLQGEVKGAWQMMLEKLRERGHEVMPVSLPSTKLALGAYYILAPAEASSNLAKYDGIRYGYRSEGPDEIRSGATHGGKDSTSQEPTSVLFAKTRGEAFGQEVQRRILLGTYTLSSQAIDNYFLQAQRVRRLIQADFNNIFAMAHPLLDLKSDRGSGAQDTSQAPVDVLIAPTAPTLPPTTDEVERQSAVEKYVGDVFTVPSSLAGLPALSVPVPLQDSTSRLQDPTQEMYQVTSAGMQVIGQYGDDEHVLDVGALIEEMYHQ